MDGRKAIIKAYKDRKLCDGVYTVINTLYGKYLIGRTANLASVLNHFRFAVATGSAFHPALRMDWGELGAQAFTLDVLEELEQRPDQTPADFLEDLRTLEQLWRANLDPSKTY